eukprot:scaffold89351_cov31-Tisochrysis_lutea.AAC.2
MESGSCGSPESAASTAARAPWSRGAREEEREEEREESEEEREESEAGREEEEEESASRGGGGHCSSSRVAARAGAYPLPTVGPGSSVQGRRRRQRGIPGPGGERKVVGAESRGERGESLRTTCPPSDKMKEKAFDINI